MSLDGPHGRVAVSDGDADTAQIAAFERDRRALLRRGLAFGGAAVAASSVPLLLAIRNAFAVADDTDGTLLEQAITLERTMVLAYDRVIDDGFLSDKALAPALRTHERRHAASFVTALTDLGGSPPAEPVGIAAVDKVAKGLDQVRNEAQTLSFLIELETAAVAAYYDAQARFVETRLLQSGASIMASEGQHLVLLRQAARRPPVPEALETGTS
jgi:hypothetical protein